MDAPVVYKWIFTEPLGNDWLFGFKLDGSDRSNVRERLVDGNNLPFVPRKYYPYYIWQNGADVSAVYEHDIVQYLPDSVGSGGCGCGCNENEELPIDPSPEFLITTRQVDGKRMDYKYPFDQVQGNPNTTPEPIPPVGGVPPFNLTVGVPFSYFFLMGQNTQSVKVEGIPPNIGISYDPVTRELAGTPTAPVNSTNLLVTYVGPTGLRTEVTTSLKVTAVAVSKFLKGIGMTPVGSGMEFAVEGEGGSDGFDIRIVATDEDTEEVFTGDTYHLMNHPSFQQYRYLYPSLPNGSYKAQVLLKNTGGQYQAPTEVAFTLTGTRSATQLFPGVGNILAGKTFDVSVDTKAALTDVKNGFGTKAFLRDVTITAGDVAKLRGAVVILTKNNNLSLDDTVATAINKPGAVFVQIASDQSVNPFTLDFGDAEYAQMLIISDTAGFMDGTTIGGSGFYPVINRDPVVVGSPAKSQVQEGGNWTLDTKSFVTDPDGDPLGSFARQVGGAALPSFVNFANGAFNVTNMPYLGEANTSVFSYHFEVVYTDPAGKSAIVPVDLDVLKIGTLDGVVTVQQQYDVVSKRLVIAAQITPISSMRVWLQGPGYDSGFVGMVNDTAYGLAEPHNLIHNGFDGVLPGVYALALQKVENGPIFSIAVTVEGDGNREKVIYRLTGGEVPEISSVTVDFAQLLLGKIVVRAQINNNLTVPGVRFKAEQTEGTGFTDTAYKTGAIPAGKTYYEFPYTGVLTGATQIKLTAEIIDSNPLKSLSTVISYGGTSTSYVDSAFLTYDEIQKAGNLLFKPKAGYTLNVAIEAVDGTEIKGKNFGSTTDSGLYVNKTNGVLNYFPAFDYTTTAPYTKRRRFERGDDPNGNSYPGLPKKPLRIYFQDANNPTGPLQVFVVTPAAGGVVLQSSTTQPQTNRPPVPSVSTITLELYEGLPFGGSGSKWPENYFSDPDGDPLTWSMKALTGPSGTESNLPGDMLFDPATRQFSGMTPAIGTYWFRIKVNDGRGGEAYINVQMESLVDPDLPPDETTTQPMQGTDWITGTSIDQLKVKRSLAVVFGSEGITGKPNYIAGAYEGHNTDVRDKSQGDALKQNKDWISLYKRYGDKAGAVTIITPIITMPTWFNLDQSARPKAGGHLEKVKARIRSKKCALQIFLPLSTDWADTNKRFWADEWNQKKSTNSSVNAINDREVMPSLVCIDDNSAGSPKIIIDKFLDQVVEYFIDEIKDGFMVGTTVLLGADTHEVRRDIQQNPVNLSSGWRTDNNPKNNVAFRQWCSATFLGSISDLHTFLRAATHTVGGVNYTLLVDNTTYSGFADTNLKLSFKSGVSGQVSWLDMLSEMYQHFMMKRFMTYCYTRINSKMAALGVSSTIRQKFLKCYDFGQPGIGPQGVASGQMMFDDLAADGNMVQENPAPMEFGSRSVDMLKGSLPNHISWTETDAAFWRQAQIAKASYGAVSGKDQMMTTWWAGGNVYGIRTPFDNPGDTTEIEPNIAASFDQIQAATGNNKAPVNIPALTYEAPDLTVSYFKRLKDASDQDGAANWKSRTTAPVATHQIDGQNHDERVRIRMVNDLTPLLPRVMLPIYTP